MNRPACLLVGFSFGWFLSFMIFFEVLRPVHPPLVTLETYQREVSASSAEGFKDLYGWSSGRITNRLARCSMWELFALQRIGFELDEFLAISKQHEERQVVGRSTGAILDEILRRQRAAGSAPPVP